MLPHWNVMPQAQDMTSHPVTVYRHRADLSLCYPLMWSATLEATTTHFNVLGLTRPRNHIPDLPHTKRTPYNSATMVVYSEKPGRNTVPSESRTRVCGLRVQYVTAFATEASKQLLDDTKMQKSDNRCRHLSDHGYSK